MERLKELYRGELFQGKTYEWSFPKAHTLEKNMISNLLKAGELREDQNRTEEAERMYLHALELARRCVGRLNREKKLPWPLKEVREPRYDPQELNGIIPADTRKPYDVREVIARIVDDSDFDEFKARFGTTLVTGFAHIHGIKLTIALRRSAAPARC